MWTKRFWKRTTERVSGAVASVVVPLGGGDLAGLLDVPVAHTLSVAASAAVLSLGKSILASRRDPKDDPSFSK